MKRYIAALGRAFLNLIYPLSCLVCGKKITENKDLCKECVSKIHKNNYGVAACQYGGVLKESIHLFKYKNFLSLLNTFSRLILEFIDRTMDMKKIDTIIPIPLHPLKFRERGFNQAYLLCLPIAKRYNVPISTFNLVKRKATEPQSGLNRSRRLKNLKNAFSVKRPESLKGKSILLVDDVYTTGTTIKSASKVLKKAGTASVKVLTLARGA